MTGGRRVYTPSAWEVAARPLERLPSWAIDVLALLIALGFPALVVYGVLTGDSFSIWNGACLGAGLALGVYRGVQRHRLREALREQEYLVQLAVRFGGAYEYPRRLYLDAEGSDVRLRHLNVSQAGTLLAHGEPT